MWPFPTINGKPWINPESKIVEEKPIIVDNYVEILKGLGESNV